MDEGRGNEKSHIGSSPKWRHQVKKQAQRKLVSAVDKIVSFSKRSKLSNFRTLFTDPGHVNVVVGPVIGKVTESSARILLEVGEPGPVVVLLEEGTKEFCAAEKTLEANRPAIFVFENLEPGTHYNVKVKGCSQAISSSFKTFPVEAAPLNFAVISCNKIFITEKEIPIHSDLWAHLERAIKMRKIDMCLHLGDQIYGDGDKLLDAEAGALPDDWSDCFKKSESLLKDLSFEQWEQYSEKICEYYREVYRKTWQHPPTAYCLANSPNLMIYDDHEVRDNWADLDGDKDSKGMDFFIAWCAWKVNVEYQRQLHEDVDFNKLKAIDKDHHFHVIADVGIMFIDIRGSRSFHRREEEECRYLGSKQWNDIEQAMNVGLFSKVKVLLVCTPAPLVFLDHKVTEVASNVPRLVDFKGHWSADPHYDEQKRMISALNGWKTSLNNRAVLVLGGDVHCGGHSDIVIGNEVAFRQLTTSAIANHPLPKSAYYLLRAAGNLNASPNRDFIFNHHDWTRSRNYGLVEIRNQGSKETNAQPEVISHLIKGKLMIGITEGVKVSNLDDGKLKIWHGCFCQCRRL